MIWRAILICASLAACSSSPDPDSSLNTVIGLLRSEEAGFVPRFVPLYRNQAEALQVSLDDQGVATGVLLERRDGAFDYWLSAQGQQLVLQGGMLHSTRGLGEGLLASELSEPLALVRAGQGGFADRFHTYLGGDDRAETRTYRCEIKNEGPNPLVFPNGPVNTVLMSESCRSLDQTFVNFYWVTPSTGKIFQARHWAGPEIGAISTRVVLR